MCGIAGFWQTKRQAEIPAEILLRMGNALKHRGPDDSGVFYDDSTGLGLVHRRLSIIDLSPAGHQPMASHSGRYLIIFNGEVYNYEEVRKELGPGHAWRGHSDTEVMLEAFERWGVEAAVRRFVGMFAFALWIVRSASFILYATGSASSLCTMAGLKDSLYLPQS